MRFFLVLLIALVFSPVGFANKPIEGTIHLDKKLKSKINAQGILYVYARAADQERGMPMAVKKITSPKFPVKFSLSKADQMSPAMPFKGPFRIVAKFAPSGDAMQKQGSLEGVTLGKDGKGIREGSAGVKVTIDTAL